jgi:peptide/nickel transport system permease protein
LILTIPVLLGVVTITFVATKLVPGDPLAGFLPDNPTPAQHAALAREFGLDQPVSVQWLRYVLRALQGDFGRSLRTGNAVASDLSTAIPATLELTLCAFGLTLATGLAVGIYAAVNQGTLADHVLTIASLGGIAAPIFWTALMAQVLFYGTLRWLPLGGRIDEYIGFSGQVAHHTGLLIPDALLSRSWAGLASATQHLILPALVLAYRESALVIRITRSTMLDVLHTQYVRTARSIGVHERRVVLRWALRNALLPIATVLGLAFGGLLQGSILVESVFNWPGLGLYTVQSILQLDYPGVITASLVVTAGFVLVNTAVDLLYPLLDPRLRYG